MAWKHGRAALAAAIMGSTMLSGGAAAQEGAPEAVPAIVSAVMPAAAPAAMPAAVPAVVMVEDAEPALPAGASPVFVPPVRDAAGYVTPNRALSPEEKTWHVRVALNVAALGCRGAEAAEMVAGYNALLTADKATLAAAATAMGARYKDRYGTAWQARHDDAMTKLYNFWALPPAQARFCGAALTVLREAATVDAAAFPVFAAAVLPRLEAPIVAFFAEFDAYRTAREAWRTRRARAMIAAAVPADGAAVALAAPMAATALATAAPAPAAATIVLIRAGAGEP